MNEEQAAEFLNLYRLASGEDASARIDGFVKAYAVFRLAYCLMAANAMTGSDEQPRLQRAAEIYRTLLTASSTRVAAISSSLSLAAS